MNPLTPADPSVDLTVCIVNWNGAKWLPDCLRSLRDGGVPQLEILVVDNASEDNSLDILRSEFPDVTLLVNRENVGFARANNQAIRQGSGRHFFLLNNDTIVAKDSLRLLSRFMDEHPGAGMVAGQLVNVDGSTQFPYYPVALPTLVSLTADLLWLNRLWPRNPLGRSELARRWDPAMASRMEQIPGACMYVRREVFEQVGLFNEEYRFWYEDVDLCTRCLRSGWELWYLPDAKIVHYGGASTKLMGFSARSLLRFRNMLRYAEKYFRHSHFFLLKVVVALVLVVRLPIVLGASLWPGTRARQLWKGTWKVYLRLLGEIVHG